MATYGSGTLETLAASPVSSGQESPSDQPHVQKQ
jgi:hypothetical protein